MTNTEDLIKEKVVPMPFDQRICHFHPSVSPEKNPPNPVTRLGHQPVFMVHPFPV